MPLKGKYSPELYTDFVLVCVSFFPGTFVENFEGGGVLMLLVFFCQKCVILIWRKNSMTFFANWSVSIFPTFSSEITSFIVVILADTSFSHCSDRLTLEKCSCFCSAENVQRITLLPFYISFENLCVIYWKVTPPPIPSIWRSHFVVNGSFDGYLHL